MEYGLFIPSSKAGVISSWEGGALKGGDIKREGNCLVYETKAGTATDFNFSKVNEELEKTSEIECVYFENEHGEKKYRLGPISRDQIKELIRDKRTVFSISKETGKPQVPDDVKNVIGEKTVWREV